MRYVTIEGGSGPAEALTLAEGPRPEPGPGQIRIRVRAAGVNRPDVLQRLGHYPPPPGASPVLGLEVAGEVDALGPGPGLGTEGSRWALGDRVCALLGGGGYAEFAIVDARHALPIPRGLSFEEAAGLPETVFTVFTNVFERGALKPGETLLLHGATSGIGVTAIQTAKAHGARVIATARGAAKAEAARRLGADVAIDTTTEDFERIALDHGGADVILDMVGGDWFARHLNVLKTDGRLVHVAFQAGAVVEADLRKIMVKRLVVTGSTLRPRDADEKARLAAAVEAVVWPWIEAGRVRSLIDRVYPLDQAAEAHRRMESGAHVGKIVLVP